MVAERFGTIALLRTNATKATVLPRLREAALIHLATHAFFDPKNSLESGIVLADGILTAREVLEHRLQADLLVLSACESGQVVSLGGEELTGLSQAFLTGGGTFPARQPLAGERPGYLCSHAGILHCTAARSRQSPSPTTSDDTDSTRSALDASLLLGCFCPYGGLALTPEEGGT